jgi:signal transduction histidine kinase/DNA-binding response OmpR family regulator/ligand-binding sensor domain-containing protein
LNKLNPGKYFLIILILLPLTLSSQNYNNIGQPIINYFEPEVYNASYQNWSVLQDNRGIMYFGNSDGILEYDGNKWRLIKTQNNSLVRSLCLDEAGRIYVAASSDFGYLAPDSIGSLQFVSLLNYLDKKYQVFGDVWDVAASSHGVYFKTRDKIFRWFENKITVIDSVYSFRLYKINDDIFTRNDGVGLLKVSGDSLALIPDGERFAATGVFNMLLAGNNILITTNADGLFLYDGKTFSTFETEADEFLVQNKIYNACLLDDGNIALATMRGGVAIIDKEGRLSRIINSRSGLVSDIIYDVFPDRQGGLWLAMAEGITRVESSPDFVILTKKYIGNKTISALHRFNNTLYGSNALGLFYLDESTSEFKPVSGVTAGGLNYISIGNYLFASSNSAIYRITEDNVARHLISFEVPYLYQSVLDTNIIYVVYRIGLAILKYNNGNLQLLSDTSPVKDEMSSIVEDVDGSLWINTYYEGVVHIKNYSFNSLIHSTDKGEIEIIRYDKTNGLPGNDCNIFSVGNKVLFATDAGLFSFDKQSKCFIPETLLGNTFTDSTNHIKLLVEDRKGDLWILANTKSGYDLGKAVKQTDSSFLWKTEPAFRTLNLKDAYELYADYDSGRNKDFLWISTNEGLIRFDPAKNKNYVTEFSTNIRSVIVDQDSLVFHGAPGDSSLKTITLSFNKRNIFFNFSAASYVKPGSNLYQYYLEGYDADWSQWTREPSKEYTNLSTGNYIFRVRAKNVYGIVGTEDSFAFTILAPWYFSWWAYFIYTVLFLGILYLIRRYELKRLNKKHILQLERVEYGKLKELDQLKSQFFANISHEFRTPLTLILGQIDSVMSSAIDNKEKGKLQVANRNARRLLTLINQLLDLSKLEAGSMELNAEQHNIVSFLKSLFFSFESLAEAQKITLKFESEYQNIPVVFDPDKMEKVFYNLVSNAFKFTSTNGEIKVSLKVLKSSEVEIQICDTGLGIPADRLPHIFDRFYQVDSSMTREHEGTGIGLALTKELVELHKGKITVNSKVNEGTEFSIYLPLGDFTKEKENLIDLPQDKFAAKPIYDDLEINFQNTEEPDQDQKSDKEQSSSVRQEIILIVEDNPDVRSYIREQLENDYRVFEAENGEQGLLTAQNEIPDLIITDVMMPKMDGYQFSKSIRSDEKTSHIPIIMLTAKAGLDDKIEGLETGIDDYLTKPFSAKELKVRVRNLIQQRNQLRKRFSKATVIKPSEVSAISADQIFLNKTVSFIEAHFADEQFSIEMLAEEVNMSVSQLNRKLNALINQPPGQLIRSLRLQRAADLLIQKTGTVAEICYKVGFNDQSYFSRSFKKQFGVSPSEYRGVNSNL